MYIIYVTVYFVYQSSINISDDISKSGDPPPTRLLTPHLTADT